jgi:single stranded DNA-binding protein
MDNVVLGHLCKEPILHQPRRTGSPVARLRVAVNPRRWDGTGYVDRPPVFHDVVCFGRLAENVCNSLRNGMEVLAVGEWVDNSYRDESGQHRVRITLEARSVGPALRSATAVVHRLERKPEMSPPAALPELALVGGTPEPVPIGGG